MFYFMIYRLQRERAEKERLAHTRRAEYLQSLQYPVMHNEAQQPPLQIQQHQQQQTINEQK